MKEDLIVMIGSKHKADSAEDMPHETRLVEFLKLVSGLRKKVIHYKFADLKKSENNSGLANFAVLHLVHHLHPDV